MQPTIFFSTRRQEDPTRVQSLRQRLNEAFGWQEVFSDYDTLHASDAWEACRKRAVRRSDAFVLLVGLQWEALAGTDDPLRQQLEWAQAAGRWIVPVTFCGGQLPLDLNLVPTMDLGDDPAANADKLVAHLKVRLDRLMDQTTPPPRLGSRVVALRLGVDPEGCDLDALIGTLTRYMALGESDVEVARVREGLVVSLRLPEDAAANLERLVSEYPDLFADFGGASLTEDEPLDEDLNMTTSMPAILLHEWEHHLATARRYLRKNQFQLARKSLEDARQQAQDAGDVFDDDGFARELQAVATDAADHAHDGLLALLEQVDEREINLRQAQDWLDAWQDALPDDQDPDYLRLKARVKTLITRRQSDAVYRNVRDRVEALWDDARMAGNDGARTEELLELLQRARDAAREAAANHPKDARFQQLVEEADQRRQRTAEEQDKMLSGAQSQQFELTLQHILATPDDETVPVYNENAVLQGRYPPRAALGVVVPQARNYANRKVNEYLTQASRELEQGMPRAARSTLSEIGKFDLLGDLVVRAGENALLYPDTVAVLNEIQSEIADAEQRLNAAEVLVNAALEMAERDALGAWETYSEGAERYPEAASYSGAFKDARPTLQRALETQLDHLLADLNGRLAVANPVSYFRDTTLHTLLGQVKEDVARYGAVDLPLRDRVRQLERIAQEADLRVQIVDSIRERMSEILSLLDEDPKAAGKALQMLENDADMRYLEAHPRYDDLRHAINLRISESAELQRLNALLDNPNPARVAAAQQAAQAAAQQSEGYAQQFERLALRLGAHRALLLADALARSEGYDSALATVEEYDREALATLDPALHGRVQAKLQQLRTNADSIGADAQRIKLAHELHERGDNAAAYAALRDVAHFHDANERRAYHAFRAEVETALTHDIMAQIDSLTLQDELDPALREQVDILQLIAPQAAERYRQRFVVLDAVQRARDLAAANQYHDAVNNLNTALPDLTGDERQTVNTLLRDYQRAVLRSDKDHAAQAVRDQQGEADDAAQRAAMTSLLTVLQQLADGARNTEQPFTRLEYLTWQLELTLLRGEATAGADARRTAFDQAEQLAEQIIAQADRLNREALTEQQAAFVGEALRLADAGRYSPTLTHAVRAVETYLHADADFGLFTDAVAQFEAALADHEPFFVTLINWYEDRIAQVQTDLRRGIEALATVSGAQGIAPVQLPFYAKLLVLDPDDSQGVAMLTELPRLAQRLTDEVERLHQGIFAQEGYALAGDTDLLDEHLQQVSQTIEQIKLLRGLLTRFAEVPALDDSTSTLLGTANRLNERLLTMDTQLRRFKDEVQRFMAQVGAVDLVDDADEQWHDAVDQIEEIWLALEDNVRAINPDLLRHPALRGAASARDEQRKRLQLLVERLREIERAVSAEDYIRADALIQSIDSTMLAFFRRTSLYTTYTAADGWYSSQVSGWRNVTDLVAERSAWQARFERWAAPFAVPQTVLTGDAAPDAPVSPSSNIVNWTDEQARIETQFAQRGDFAAALAAVERALEGNDDSALLALRPAQKRALSPVLAMADSNTTGSHQEAQQQAGSQRARRALTWIQAQRAPQLQAAVRAAEAYRAELKGRAESWKRAEAALVEAVKRLSARLEQRGLFGRLRDGNALSAAVQDYETVLLQMEQLAARHPHLTQYQQDPDYRAALRRVGENA